MYRFGGLLLLNTACLLSFFVPICSVWDGSFLVDPLTKRHQSESFPSKLVSLLPELCHWCSRSLSRGASCCCSLVRLQDAFPLLSQYSHAQIMSMYLITKDGGRCKWNSSNTVNSNHEGKHCVMIIMLHLFVFICYVNRISVASPSHLLLITSRFISWILYWHEFSRFSNHC